jgi:hypothetical protein
MAVFEGWRFVFSAWFAMTFWVRHGYVFFLSSVPVGCIRLAAECITDIVSMTNICPLYSTSGIVYFAVVADLFINSSLNLMSMSTNPPILRLKRSWRCWFSMTVTGGRSNGMLDLYCLLPKWYNSGSRN